MDQPPSTGVQALGMWATEAQKVGGCWEVVSLPTDMAPTSFSLPPSPLCTKSVVEQLKVWVAGARWNAKVPYRSRRFFPAPRTWFCLQKL